jgi:choice-of-anchor C domain-containing protein
VSRARGARSSRWLGLAAAFALAVSGLAGVPSVSVATGSSVFTSLAPTLSNLVTNGGFELPPVVNASLFDTYVSPAPGITGWSLDSGSVDLIKGYWSPSEGSQSIDLDGSAPDANQRIAGAISQVLTTIPGHAYLVSFDYSANFERPSADGPAGMDVRWGASTPLHVDHNPGSSSTAMGWTQGQVTVTATGTTTQLSFVSTDAPGSAFGIALDNVSVTTAVPPAPAPVLFGAVPNGGVAGLVKDSVPAGTAYHVTFYTSATCGDPEPALLNPTPSSITTNSNGIAAFALDFSLTEGTYIRAQASLPGGPPSAFSNCVRVEPNNTSWPTATPLSLDASSHATASGYLQNQGEARWFKVPILPNGRVDITLSQLPADYDLIVFSDIGAAYAALTAGATSTTGPSLALTDLAKQDASAPGSAFNTSQYNPSAWDPTNWNPTLNTTGLNSSQWSPSQWSPSQWSASQWAPSQWSPSQWSPSQWSPSQWSPSQWSPSQWSPSQWSPSQWSGSFPNDPKIFTSAQTSSLLAVSAGTGLAAESISVNTWNNTGDVYIRVQGKNGSFDPSHPFSLAVTREGNVCAGVSDQASSPSAVADIVGGVSTVILTDSHRMTIDPTLAGKLATFAGKVNGAIVDVSADPTVAALNDQADTHASCPYAKNLVGSAIKRIVDAYRAAYPVRYVVVIGSDGVIPFFRYPDPALLGNETLYSPPVLDASASQASLRLGYVLNQDAYGTRDQVSVLGAQFPVPDLAVGRLIETPAEIGGMLDAYNGLTNGIVATPTTSLVTGYDFLQDAADAVASNLRAGIGGTGNATLITNEGVAPGTTTVNGTPDRLHSWTGADLRRALLQSGRHDLVFLAGHFSANDALAADYATNILSTELGSSSTDFTNSIVFSAGCHSGYNIVNGDAIPNVTEPMDWAEAFAGRKATLIAGTGYQYGDTDFLAYSERIYAEFSRQLLVTTDPQGQPTPVAVGDALVRSKRVYLKTTPSLTALDEKALLESTLFGLPMLGVNLQHGRIYQAPDSSTIASITPVATGTPGSALGLGTADTSVTGALAPHSLQLKNPDLTNGPVATYLTPPDGSVVLRPMQPILPLVSANVTSPSAGYLLRGAGLRGGTYTETSGVTPLTAAPATELRGIHAPFFTDVLFPVEPWSVNSFDAIGGAGVTRLQVTPVQHVSDANPLTSTRRQFSDMDFRLFYSNDLSAAALAAPPTITGVDSSFDATTGTLTFRARALGDPTAGIQAAWATWTIPPLIGQQGTWQSVDLAQDAVDPSLWTGTAQLPAGADPGSVAFMVQAANGDGRVTLDANVGAYYHPGSIPGAPTGTTTAPAATVTAFTSGPPPTVAYGSSFTVTASLSSGGAPLAGKLVRIGIGSSLLPAITDTSGQASVALLAALTPGSYPVTASFAGDGADASSSATAPVAITPQPTSLVLSGTLGTQTFGGTLSVVATLNAGTPPAALAQRPVFVIFTGTGPASPGIIRVFAGRTDPLGRVVVPASTLGSLPAGSYSVDAYFSSVPAPVSLALSDVGYLPAHGQATLSLRWPFNGFLYPVKNPPTLDLATAGSAVPIRFALGGNRGLGILTAGSPVVTTVACPTGVATNTVPALFPVPANFLVYIGAPVNQYLYVWKTSRSWAGTCRQFDLQLADGSDHVAIFKFQ